jgi:2-methylcitrate dehydratase PrpD
LGVLKTGFALVVVPEEKKYNPQTIVDAQFSMPFGAAVAMLYGKATLDEYTRDNIRSSRVKKLMNRVDCIEDPDLETAFPQKWPASVTLQTKDGKQFSLRIEYPKGDPENPLTWEEIIEKFRGLTGSVFQKERINRIIDQVRALDKIDDVKTLSKLLGK